MQQRFQPDQKTCGLAYRENVKNIRDMKMGGGALNTYRRALNHYSILCGTIICIGHTFRNVG